MITQHCFVFIKHSFINLSIKITTIICRNSEVNHVLDEEEEDEEEEEEWDEEDLDEEEEEDE